MYSCLKLFNYTHYDPVLNVFIFLRNISRGGIFFIGTVLYYGRHIACCQCFIVDIIIIIIIIRHTLSLERPISACYQCFLTQNLYTFSHASIHTKYLATRVTI